MMRKALAALLFLLAGVCLTFVGTSLANLFDDYKDSPDSTYLEAAATAFAPAVLFVVGGALALRKS